MVDGFDIELYVYEPQSEVRTRGVIQLVHGSCEHAKRYEQFISYLLELGYVVYANDHRGHGESVLNPEDYGYFGETNGWFDMVEDLKVINDLIHAQHPDLPIVMLGHSMGSFLARHYAIDYGETINGLILTGTAHQPSYQLKLGKFAAKLIKKLKGSRHRSMLIYQLSYGSFNRQLKGAKTSSDWICYDDEVVKAFCEDSKCGFIFTSAGFEDLFTGLLYMTNRENIKRMPHDLPVLMLSGEDDPVGGYGRMVLKSYEAMKEAGLLDIQYTLYPKMRHEILNEREKFQVYSQITTWLNEII